jgi:hypothetical protein
MHPEEAGVLVSSLMAQVISHHKGHEGHKGIKVVSIIQSDV